MLSLYYTKLRIVYIDYWSIVYIHYWHPIVNSAYTWTIRSGVTKQK